MSCIRNMYYRSIINSGGNLLLFQLRQANRKLGLLDTHIHIYFLRKRLSFTALKRYVGRCNEAATTPCKLNTKQSILVCMGNGWPRGAAGESYYNFQRWANPTPESESEPVPNFTNLEKGIGNGINFFFTILESAVPYLLPGKWV